MKPYYEHAGITIYHGDCREILPKLPNVDLVLTDPPYSKQTHDGALTNRTTGIQKLVDFEPVTLEQLKEIYEIILLNRWCISFMDYAHVVGFEKEPPKGLRSVRFGIWIKDNPMPQLSGDRPAQGFEAISILHKEGGRMRWNSGGKPAVWYSSIGNGLHPTGKPLALVTRILSDFSEENETILDPFMGSGTTLRAAKDLGRKAIGIEIEEKYCEIAAKRMQQEVLVMK